MQIIDIIGNTIAITLFQIILIILILGLIKNIIRDNH